MLQRCMYALLGYDAVAHYGVELGSQTLPLGFLGTDPGSISYSLSDLGQVFLTSLCLSLSICKTGIRLCGSFGLFTSTLAFLLDIW